eukprot:g22760.t1
MEGRPPLEFLVSKLPELLEHFGLQGEFRWKELDSFDDRNLMDGRKYVVKAHNTLLPSGSLERLDAQDRLMCQLHSQGLPVPEVLYRDGCSTYTLPSPVPALVRILTYLEACTSHLHLTRSKLPFISADRRPLAERLCHAYAERLCTERPEHGGRLCDVLPHTVLHADLNDSLPSWNGRGGWCGRDTNLLFADDEVVGVIDFGDSIHSCRIFEPGITAGRADGGDGCTARLFRTLPGYFSLGQADPVLVLSEVLRGYLQRVPWEISEDEVLAYFHVARGRILLSVAFAAENRHLEPDNEYLAHTAEPGWAVLTALDCEAEVQGARAAFFSDAGGVINELLGVPAKTRRQVPSEGDVGCWACWAPATDLTLRRTQRSNAGLGRGAQENSGGDVLHLSQACLSQPQAGKNFLQVIEGDKTYSIACLQKDGFISGKKRRSGRLATVALNSSQDKSEFASFDLFFRTGTCTFHNKGASEMHLTGYFEPDGMPDDLEDEESEEEEEEEEESRVEVVEVVRRWARRDRRRPMGCAAGRVPPPEVAAEVPTTWASKPPQVERPQAFAKEDLHSAATAEDGFTSPAGATSPPATGSRGPKPVEPGLVLSDPDDDDIEVICEGKNPQAVQARFVGHWMDFLK